MEPYVNINICVKDDVSYSDEIYCVIVDFTIRIILHNWNNNNAFYCCYWNIYFETNNLRHHYYSKQTGNKNSRQ